MDPMEITQRPSEIIKRESMEIKESMDFAESLWNREDQPIPSDNGGKPKSKLPKSPLLGYIRFAMNGFQYLRWDEMPETIKIDSYNQVPWTDDAVAIFNELAKDHFGIILDREIINKSVMWDRVDNTMQDYEFFFPRPMMDWRNENRIRFDDITRVKEWDPEKEFEAWYNKLSGDRKLERECRVQRMKDSINEMIDFLEDLRAVAKTMSHKEKRRVKRAYAALFDSD